MSAATAAHLRIGRSSASRGDSAKQRADDEERRPGDQHHVQAGDGEDVAEAGDAQARRWSLPRARSARRRAAPRRPRRPRPARAAMMRCDDRRADSRHREIERKARRLLLERPLAEHKAAAADPLEECGAVRVVAAGHDRRRTLASAAH